ncbi:MAG: carboxypeptidase regulatory-like domain-containing protein [Gammaproteobacteria bacterium]|nr:carboxypeptidase regulatory-like domain-containing protein [Gammaproteobacteria bacterium]
MFSLFKTVTIEVFPAVSGRITYHGKPSEGVKLRRLYILADVMDEEARDYAITDADGRFSFPALTMNSDYPSKPFAYTRVFQVILVEDAPVPELRELRLWHAWSRGTKHNRYYMEMLGELNCELTSSEEGLTVYSTEYPDGAVNYGIYSICRWPKRAAIEAQKAKDLEEFEIMKSPQHYGDPIIFDNPKTYAQ